MTRGIRIPLRKSCSLSVRGFRILLYNTEWHPAIQHRTHYYKMLLMKMLPRYYTHLKSPNDDHRLVRLLQILDLFLGQLDVQRTYDPVSALSSPFVRRVPARLLTEKLLEVREVRRADDGRGHTGLREDPRKRDLRHLHAFLLRELFHTIMQRGHGQKKPTVARKCSEVRTGRRPAGSPRSYT